MDEDDLERLLAAASAGDQAAWNTIVGRYNRLLWAIARGYRLDSASAADVVQTTWLRLVENLDRIAEPARLASWLATTTRHECLQVLRRSKRESPAPVAEQLADAPDNARALDAGLLDDERDAALWRAFGELPERCQLLLRVLMASPPPTYAAVSAALDVPVGTIGPTRQRCLAHLRRLALADDLLGSSPRNEEGGCDA
jgi:RNA polymerase sigma factor (sigma-70 family)